MDLIDIAKLDEARHAQALIDGAPETRPIGGGIAARGHPGSWVNAVIGAGLAGPVPGADLEAVTEWYEAAGIEPRFELTPFVDRGLLNELERMRFVLRSFETVLFRELAAGERVSAVHPAPPGLCISVVDPADDAAVRAYVLVAMSGFYPPGSGPTEEDVRLVMGFARHPRTVSLTASLDDRIVGAGACEIVDGRIAALFGVSVLPEFRRRGVQQALLATRLNMAAERGCRVATIGSRPGAGTERNVRRMGFQTAYTKVCLCRPGEGLAAAPSPD